jgi:hypothetical protein
LAQDGRQVRRPSWIWVTSLCYILLNKFVALVGSGRQTCRPSRDEKGLKDWAIDEQLAEHVSSCSLPGSPVTVHYVAISLSNGTTRLRLKVGIASCYHKAGASCDPGPML